jgi:1,4-alpha-glucan branching enzyme
MLFAGFFFLPRWFQGPVTPGLEVVRQTTGPNREKVYWVRFAIHQPGAESVSLVGDFNQWNAQLLKKGKEEIYSVELKLNEGTYAYGFMVNGRRWVPDATAHRLVPDGFGGYNSLINL